MSPLRPRIIHKIDATGQAPGRLASRVAVLLIGKHKSDYAPNVDGGDFVAVENAGKMRVTGNKMAQKRYIHYTGYPRGLRVKTMKTLWSENPGKTLEHAVSRMLPKNRLRGARLRRLTIK